MNIIEGQKQKLQAALHAGGPVSIRLSHKDLNGSDVLALTQSQANKLTKAYTSNKGVTLRMSKSQVKYNMTVEGGFWVLLPALL